MQQTIFTCALCGNPLHEKPKRRLRKDAIYCSNSCRTRANNERRRLRRIGVLLERYLTDVNLACKNVALEYEGKRVALDVAELCMNVINRSGWQG